MDKIVLVDMDGVISNFEKGILDCLRRSYPDKPFVSLDKRVNFEVEKDYPENIRQLIRDIYSTKGFFT